MLEGKKTESYEMLKESLEKIFAVFLGKILHSLSYQIMSILSLFKLIPVSNKPDVKICCFPTWKTDQYVFLSDNLYKGEKNIIIPG